MRVAALMRLAAPRAPPAGRRSLSDKVADMRLDHGGGGLQLSERTAGDAPLPLFERWFAAASRHPGVVEPNAMALSTVAPSGQPSCRVVLLKATARPLACGRHHKEIASGNKRLEREPSRCSKATSRDDL